VAVATLDARAYYAISRLLQGAGLPYKSVTPGTALRPEIRLVVTTRKERHTIRGSPVICLEELGEDAGPAKARLLNRLYPSRDDVLVIGIDPGQRTGLAVFYGHREVSAELLSSPGEVLRRITRYIDCSPAIHTVVRIGSGAPDLAQHFASEIRRRHGSAVSVELVDERGTSLLSKRIANRRGARDLRAARVIAFRRGRSYPFWA
jgi:hypothetical protein